MSIVPAVIPTSRAHVLDVVERAAVFSRALQIDLTDGVFVPSSSWPFSGGTVEDIPQLLLDISHHSPHLVLEVDAMLMEPEKYIASWIASGAERIVIHIESTKQLDWILAQPRKGAKIGLSLSNDTPLSNLEPYITRAHFIQFMGIAHIGVQGQPFDERVVSKIHTIHNSYPPLELSVDGSVNTETLSRLHAAGASRFIVGSAIFGSENPQASFEKLSAQLAG